MAKAQVRGKVSAQQLPKSLTGIRGFDEITNGGLPKGRPTLVMRNAGCGKTLFGMEFLVRGAVQFKEPGVFMSFEEPEDELTKNFASLGFDLSRLLPAKNCSLIMCTSNEAKSRRPVSMTWKVCLSGLGMLLIP